MVRAELRLIWAAAGLGHCDLSETSCRPATGLLVVAGNLLEPAVRLSLISCAGSWEGWCGQLLLFELLRWTIDEESRWARPEERDVHL